MENLDVVLGAGGFLVALSGAMFGMVRLALNGTKQSVKRIDETVTRIAGHCSDIDNRVSRIEGYLDK